MARHVVILGAGPAGLSLTHKLLKTVSPRVPDLKITLVSPSTHLFWNLAAVRGLIPGEIPDESLFRPIAPGFKSYPSSQFEFLVGAATALDTKQNAVQVTAADGSVRVVPYDQLVLATGSSISSGLPFKTLGSYEETVAAWHALQARVEAAQRIVIAGAGPTGVETAGELAFRYGTAKKVTLVASGDHALPDLLPGTGQTAEGHLRKVGVRLVRNAKVESAVEDDKGKTKLRLSDGSTLEADLYLPLYGVKPNVQYVPKELQDGKGSVRLQKTLRVEGTQNVWGVGDVGNLESKQLIRVDPQVTVLVKNLQAVLGGNEAAVVQHKVSTKPAMFVTVGKKLGTGQMGNFKMFGFLVSYMKGRTLFVEAGGDLAAGKV